MMKGTEFQSCVAPVVRNRQGKGEPTRGEQSQPGFAKLSQVRQRGGKEKPFEIAAAGKWPKSVSLFVLQSLGSGKGWIF